MVKIKKIALSLLSAGILGVVAVSCQNDDLNNSDYSEKEQVNSIANHETKIYNQQQVNEKFSTGFFQESQGGDKSVFSTSNYRIIDDYIESVEERDLHTLTYLVEYNDDPELFVNLVLYSYDYKEYTPMIFRYDIKKSDYKTGMKMPSDKIKAIPVKQGQDYGEVLTNVKSYVPGFTTDDCIDVEYVVDEKKCASGAHSIGEDCDYLGQPGKEASVSYMLVMDFSDCFDGGGGSGGGGGGGSTGGSPGGNPGGGNPGGGGGLPGGGVGSDPKPTRPIHPIKTTPIKYIPTGQMNVSLFLFNLQYGGNADLYQWWQDNAETEEWQEVYDYVYDGGNKTVAKEMIESMIDGTNISLAPFLRYPPGSNYAELYPIATEYIKNKLSDLAFNEQVINHLVNYSELSEEQIKKDLEWGNGPIIRIREDIEDICGELCYGFFNPNAPDYINIDIGLIENIEESNIDISQEALGFLLGVTILHEYVHFGETQDGDYTDDPDSGLLFEVEAFGEQVWFYNYEEVFLKFKE